MLLVACLIIVGFAGGLIQAYRPQNGADHESASSPPARDATAAQRSPPVLIPTPGNSSSESSSSPTAGVQQSAGASCTPQQRPSQSTSVPPVIPPQPTHATLQPPTFAPIIIEAEARSNQLIGGAMPVGCATCSGGYRVRFIAFLAEVVLIATIPAAGSRTITVTYESDGPRLMKVSANGVEIAARWITGDGWESPHTFVLNATLAAGPLHLSFYNDAGPAPDLDKAVIK